MPACSPLVRCALFLLLLTVGVARPGWAQVVINEYSVSNFTGPTDAFGQREDWVELYNTGTAALTLSGMHLSDNPAAPAKWVIPAGVTIAAGGRKMVFCSDRDLATAGGAQLHPSFKLTQCRGESFLLADASGAILDVVTLDRTQANHSRGRTTDGAATWALFDVPTPNAANTGARTAYTDPVTASVAAGFYPGPQTVSLSTPLAGATIYYTTNGTVPTTAATLYTGPISITATTVLRARAFSGSTSYPASFTLNNTYFINETIAPTMNVVSVAGNFTTLFASGTRIFSSYEFFDKARVQQFETEGQFRRHGNDSWAYPQKGIRFHTQDGLGVTDDIPYQIFSATPRDSFNVVIMKAAGSDNYNGGPPTSAHLRDAFCQTLAEQGDMELDVRRYEPTVLFVNGQYWGIYELRERVDADYTEYNYNQTERKVDMLRFWGGLDIEYGSDTGWVNLYNYIMANPMSVAANYDHVKEYLDVESLIDYFILNTWMVNSDWLNWNSMWWRGRKGPGVKWRYALWDQDNILGLGQNYTGMGTTGPTNDPCEPFNLFPSSGPNIGHSAMINRLMDNPDFDKLYRDRFIQHLNGPLDCPQMLAHLDSIVAIIEPEMNRQIARWGGSYTDWQTNVTDIRTWITTRCSVMGQKLDSCMDLNPQRLVVNAYPPGVAEVALDGKTLSPLPWSRIMTGDSVYTLAATPTATYWTFSHWEKNGGTGNIWNPDPTTSPAVLAFAKADSVTAIFTYENTDSLDITFDVDGPGMGTIKIEGTPLASYPATLRLDRRRTYRMQAVPALDHSFRIWTKNLDSTSIAPFMYAEVATLSYRVKGDTVIAHFDTIPPPPPPPPVVLADTMLRIPTAFTPNGDGRNDCFGIAVGRDVRAVDLKIYNRWGQLVWSTRDRRECWSGDFGGVPQPIGTYYYTLSVQFSNTRANDFGWTERRGDVTLIR